MRARHGLITAGAAAAAATLSLTLAAPAGADSTVANHAVGGPVLAQDTEEFSPIEGRYWGDEDLRSDLGNPVDTEYSKDGTSWQQFQHGWMTHTEDAGAHEVHGAIGAKYGALGVPFKIGVATSNELSTPDEMGRFNTFAGTDSINDPSIYWSPETGAHGVWNASKAYWAHHGYETGFLSYPTSTTAPTRYEKGMFTHFIGADGAGASVYSSRDSDAHSVRGAIREHWAQLGWEDSYLGFPTSDEYSIPGGQRSDFQGGYITWDSSTGMVEDYSY